MRRSVVVLAVLVAACGGEAKAPAAAVAVADTVLLAPPDSAIEQDPAAASIRRGLAILLATRDSLPANVGNGLRCVSCHLHEGRRAFANPWVGSVARYPRYAAREGREVTIEDRINECFRRSLNGKAIAADGRDMHDILAYIGWLSSMKEPRGIAWGAGIDTLKPIAPDTVRGRDQFQLYCSRCHGRNGQGGQGSGVLNPGTPLWGPQSFSIGSEMARPLMVASWAHRHMPFDAPGFVAESIAYNVAGYVTSQPRPDYAGKELDWPNGDAPSDSRYKTLGKAKPGASRP